MDNKNIKSLLEAVLALKNLSEARRFFRDLLTPAELEEFGNRWLAAQMLNANVSYNTIVKKTRLSSTTVARISKWLKRGRGGYKLMLKRKGKHHTSSKSLGKGLG
jgi:TrpR-related protein YerC/YecD